jgi:glucose-1-phosphate cytidylyltransferase
MKVVILAGGMGSRISEETQTKPKALIEAGSKKLIWHVMQSYSRHGFNDFIVLAGYKGDLIRNYFANFWINQADITFDLQSSSTITNEIRSVPWKVTVLETGVGTSTGSRIALASKFLTDDFFLTYVDGIANININELLHFHKKTNNDNNWINGGFFVVSKDIFKFFPTDDFSFEYDTLPKVARKGLLNAYKHENFWQPVDTMQDLNRLELAIKAGKLPWM